MRILFFLAILFLGALWACNNPAPIVDAGPFETRTLYLVRHGKLADENIDSIAPIDKTLSKAGKEDATALGQQLMMRGIVLDRILCSTAKHARTTAKRMGEELNFLKDSIALDSTLFKCPTIDLINAIRNTDAKFKSLLVVAHNPALIQAANHFQQDTIFMDLPTAGVIAIEFKSNSWDGLANKDGKFLFFDYPKLYKVKEEKEIKEVKDAKGKEASE